MPPMQTANFADLLAPGLRKIIFESYKEYPEEYTQLLNMNTSERNYEDDYKMSGLGTVPEKAEGGGVTYADAVAGDTKRYTHVSYGLGFKISHEMWNDDLYGKMKQMSKALGRSFRNLAEVQGASIYNNATSATAPFAGIDGLALLSTAHTTLNAGGETFSNRPAADTDISYAAVQSGIVHFHQLEDESSMPVLMRPSMAIVTPTDQFKASEIFLQEAKPNSAERDDNFVRKAPNGYGISDFFISHYITDADRWFLQARKGEHSLNFFWRERPSFDTADDFDTKTVKVLGFGRLSVGHTDWRGVYGAPGA